MSLLTSLITTYSGSSDADLTALADNAINGIWVRTGNGTGAAREITSSDASVTITNGDGVSGNIDLSVSGGGGGGGASEEDILNNIYGLGDF